MSDSNYYPPPARKALFLLMDKASLDALNWDVEVLDGDISAPNAIPTGGTRYHGAFGYFTSYTPREWEAHAAMLDRLKARLKSWITKSEVVDA